MFKKKRKKNVYRKRKKKNILQTPPPTRKKKQQPRLEPLTCAQRVGHSTAEPKYPRIRKISPGDGSVPSPELKRLSYNGNLKQGTRLRKCWKPLSSGGFPRGDSFPCCPLAKFGVGARLFAEDTLHCRLGWAWRGRAAAEGPVALGRAGPPRGAY